MMDNAPAARNVEIKASIRTIEDFQRMIDIAERLTGTAGVLLKQHDIFFNHPSNLLKMRFQEGKKCELIEYDRLEADDPSLSEYKKIEVDDPDGMRAELSLSRGIKGVVSKQRLLFMHESTRIHLDTVDSLGYFLEFEVMLREDQTVEEGTAIANELLKTFTIDRASLISKGYLHLLLQGRADKSS